ncbi:hypothetical protein [Polycladidibacter hongkongensis]|uniref:hypothetical protein n=1 Tax=Polycladidibacter hongkongensis TaxID=1647556 RepID=UPI00082A0D55|nr:hypothetical protein [Pseudovibrio hongkongensis]
MRALRSNTAERVLNDPFGRKQLRKFMVSNSDSAVITLSDGQRLQVAPSRAIAVGEDGIAQKLGADK